MGGGIKKVKPIYLYMGKSQASDNKVKPTPEGMILTLKTMLLWWNAEKSRVQHELRPGWKSIHSAISECIADVSAIIENWENNNQE